MTTAPERTPVTVTIDAGDLAYIVDALLDAAEAREGRGGSLLHARIAAYLEDLAIRLHAARTEALEVAP